MTSSGKGSRKKPVQFREYQRLFNAFRTAGRLSNNHPGRTALDLFDRCLKEVINEVEAGGTLESLGRDRSERIAAIHAMAYDRFHRRAQLRGKPLLFYTYVDFEIPGCKPESLRVAAAPLDFKTEGLYNDVDGLCEFKPDAIAPVTTRLTGMVQDFVRQDSQLMCFPELCLPESKIDDIVKEVCNSKVLAVIGTYHSLRERSNVAVVVTPNGKVYRQHKANRSRLENIEPAPYAPIFVFRSRDFNLISLTCLDVEHPSLQYDLLELRHEGKAIDIILNPSMTPRPDRARSKLTELAHKVCAMAVFVNNHRSGGSFVFDMTAKSYSADFNTPQVFELPIAKLREFRGTLDGKHFVAPDGG